MSWFSAPSNQQNGFAWQKMPHDGNFNSATTFRAKVPGGWLIAVQAHTGVGVTFYPDPSHQWQGTNEA